jgi:hypothetical protein
MTPEQQRALVAAGALVVGTSLLKRSRLVRLAVAGAVAVVGYGKLAHREPVWHEVEVKE